MEKLAKGLFPPAVEAKVRLAIGSRREAFHKALAKGVKIGLGTDAGVYPHGPNMNDGLCTGTTGGGNKGC